LDGLNGSSIGLCVFELRYTDPERLLQTRLFAMPPAQTFDLLRDCTNLRMLAVVITQLDVLSEQQMNHTEDQDGVPSTAKA
jgi:hypothetical protein